MRAPVCAAPLEWSDLLAYRLGELDADAEACVEEHYLGCDHCSRRLATLITLARAVRTSARAGDVGAAVDDGFIRRLSADGQHVREYRVPANGSVNCTVAPEDDFVVARLEAALADVTRVDLVYVDPHDRVTQRQEDVPFVAASGGVVVATPAAVLRALPATILRIRLLSVDEDGERSLGEYAFHHRPWRA